MDRAADAAEKILNQTLKKAESLANDLIDWVECKLYPGACEHQRRIDQYKSQASQLLHHASESAKASDYLTAYALAKGVVGLGARPPYSSWSLGSAKANAENAAEALAAGYKANADLQYDQGTKGSYKIGTIPWGLIGAGLGALAIIRGKR